MLMNKKNITTNKSTHIQSPKINFEVSPVK